MLFLAWRFDHFATQYRRFCRFIDHLSEQLPKVRLDIMTVEATRHGIQQFKTIEQSMLPCMLAFEQHTRSWEGWVVSFIPGTKAYSARAQLANSLNKSSRLMNMLEFVNTRVTKAMKKAAHKPRQIRNDSHPRRTHTQQPAPTFRATHPQSAASSWLSLLGKKQHSAHRALKKQPACQREKSNSADDAHHRSSNDRRR